MHRKEFIKNCSIAVLSASALATLMQSCTSTNYFAQTFFSGNKITIKKSEFVKADKTKTVMRKYVLVKSDNYSFPICLFKLSEDNYSALLMECTHRSCELQHNGSFLICPCHGSEFSNTGEVQNPPAEENLKTFKTTTDNDHIYIQL